MPSPKEAISVVTRSEIGGRARNRLLLVNYHYVRDPGAAPYAGIHAMAPPAFAEQVGALARRFHMPHPDEALAFLRGQAELPGPSLLLTFDDGLKDHAWVAREVLEPLGLRGIFFAISRPLNEGRAAAVHKVHWLRAHLAPKIFRQRFLAALPREWRDPASDAELRRSATAMYVYDTVEEAILKFHINFRLPRQILDGVTSAMLAEEYGDEGAFCAATYLSADELAALHRAGHVVGAHGHTHAPFSALAAAELDAEMNECVAMIDRYTGGPPRWVAYPYGRERALPNDPEALCRRFGLDAGLTLQVGWNDGTGSPYVVKRINCNELPAMTAQPAAASARP